MGAAPPPVLVGDGSSDEEDEEDEAGRTGAAATGAAAMPPLSSPPRVTPAAAPCMDGARDATALRDLRFVGAEPQPLDGWSPADVADWLRGSGLEKYADAFYSQHVDGPSLRLLSRDDLNALGVGTVGHRLQILRGVAELSGGRAHSAHQHRSHIALAVL